MTLFRWMILFALPCLLSAASSRAQATEVETHGFFTLGYATSDSPVNYLGSISNQGSFSALSNAGVQFGATLNDRLSVKLQFVADGRQDQTVTPKIDLAQARYLLAPGFDLIAGQIRLPLFLISDYRMVGALYPWSIPPAEVYQLLPDEAVGSNQTLIGANLVSQLLESGGWTLQTETYAGGSYSHLTPQGKTIDAVSKRILGADASLSYSQLVLRVSYLNTLNHSMTTTPGTPSVDSSLGTIQFLTAGAKWEPGDVLLQSEFAHIFGENPKFKQIYSFYGTAGYHFFSRHLLLHATFAQILGLTQSSDSLVQTSISGGFNYSLGESVVFKLEAQQTTPGTTQAPPQAPGSPPPPKGLFGANQLSAVTLYFASVSATF